MNNLKDIYFKRLPSHLFATDDFETDQLGFYPLSTAIQKAIVQHNFRNSFGWLVYDVDRETASFDWEDLNAPEPNIIVVNPVNGHAHLFYGLNEPVHNNPNSSMKPLKYFASIDIALTHKLEADPRYTKLLSKNPTNEKWVTIYKKNELYDLAELADWLDLERYNNKRKDSPAVGYGRNCLLFEKLRRWAYRERRQGYLSAELFHDAVLMHAHVINSTENDPLLHNAEVRHTAKSVSRWVWRRMSNEGFRAYQSRMGKLSGIVRKKRSLELREAIIEAVRQCPTLTQEDIGALMGVTRETVNRHLNSRV